jgi:predicted alpha-1,6-mannanase (GH76 family)
MRWHACLALGQLDSTMSQFLTHPALPQVPVHHETTATASPTGNSLLNTTQAAINVFLDLKRDDGLIKGITYWQVANGYTAIALHDIWCNASVYSETLGELIKKVKSNQTNFINEFNDDSIWWAMCLLELFSLNHEPRHLSVAQAIWKHVGRYVIPPQKYIINGVDMAGGVMWTSKPSETQVNAITTGLYAELSARLATLQPDEAEHAKLLSSAMASFSWILRVLFDKDRFLVLDHIDLDTGQTTNWTFTYTTGQAIRASVAIYSALKANLTSFHNAKYYLNLACTLARHAMAQPTWVNVNGTLTEESAYPGTGPHKKRASENDDAVGFKAILLRHMAQLYTILVRDGVQRDMREKLRDFIEWQYCRVRERDSDGEGRYGPWWDGPMDTPTGHSQMAVLDVMAAIHAVQRDGEDEGDGEG